MRMRKFTLLLAALAISMGGAAQTRSADYFKMIASENSAKAKYPNLEQFQVTSVRNEVLSPEVAIKNKLQANAVKRTVAKAEEELYAEPAYFNAYEICTYYGYALPAYMQPAYIAAATNEVYVQPFGNYADYFDFIQGTVTPGTHAYSDYEGVDSLTFTNGQVVGGLSDGTNLCLYSCDLLESGQAGYKASPLLTDATFGGYYFRETGELIIPYVLGVFGQNTTNLYTETYMNLIAFPMSDLLSDMYWGSVSATDYLAEAGEEPVISADSLIVLDNGEGYFIQGGNLYGGTQDTWLPLVDDGVNSYIPSFTYIGTYSFGNSTNPTPADCMTVALMPSSTSGMNIGDSVAMVKTMAVDFTTTYTSQPGGYMLGAFLWNSDTFAGYYTAYADYKLTIDSEPIFAGIDGVTESKRVVSKEYYDLSGRKVDSTAKGLVIERVRYADGKTMSRKVVK